MMLKMDKMKRHFECYVPVTKCNLHCEYCYVIHEGRRTDKMPVFNYSAAEIGKAVNKERLGGICSFKIVGDGETLFPDELINIIFKILEAGHYVKIVTNGTLTKQFQNIAEFPKDYLKRILFQFSLHYIELVRTNNLNTYFNNIKLTRSLGSSFFMNLNLNDEYIPYLEEIKNVCLKELGQLPVLSITKQLSPPPRTN